MPAPNGNRDRGTAATTPRGEAPRTIEDIEARQRVVRSVEIDALVTVLRDIAVALPVESKMTYDLADAAKRLYADIKWLVGSPEHGKPAVCTGNVLSAMQREIAEEMARWKSEEE